MSSGTALPRWCVGPSLSALLVSIFFVAGGAGPASGAVRILEAMLDTPEAGVLTIRGEDFPTSPMLRAVVCLGERSTPLDHTVVNASEIHASIPPALAPGSYLLTVNTVLAAATPQCPAGARSPRGRSPDSAAFELAVGDPTWQEIQDVICPGAPNPRPGVCPAVGSCRCPFAPGVPPECTLTETSPGDFLVEKNRNVPPSVCRIRAEPDLSRCASSSLGECSTDAQCSGGETCVFRPTLDESQCMRPCASDADCGPLVIPQNVSYAGVQPAGSRNTVVCTQPSPFPPTLLSNNDARACIEFWESVCAP